MWQIIPISMKTETDLGTGDPVGATLVVDGFSTPVIAHNLDENPISWIIVDLAAG
jgi:hypothetical protein